MDGRHRDALPLLHRRSQIAGKGGIVRVDGRLHGEVTNLCLGPGLVIQADFLEIPDIRENGVVIGLVRGVEGGGLRGFRRGEIRRRAGYWRVDARLVEGHRIVE